MIIKNVAASLGGRIVTNEEVIDMIRYNSKEFNGDLDRALTLIHKFLKKSGIKERRWCDRHELPIDHVAIAVDEALKKSYLRKSHIELLIYVGIGRGFMEPGNSHMIANALGFDKAQCFDIVDACMSWIRAMDLVDSLFKTGRYKNAIIINAEFNMLEGGPLYPDNFNLKIKEQIPYTFPGFTIGEAATATLLIPKEPENFEFHFSTRPDLSHLCTVPLNGYEQFCHPAEEIGKNGVLNFTSYGSDLHKHANPETVKIFKQMSSRNEIKKVFVHASSSAEWDKFGKSLGISEKIHHIYPNTGNLVSASIPAAMTNAIEQDELKRGNNIAFWVGSAGMSFNATRFIY